MVKISTIQTETERKKRQSSGGGTPYTLARSRKNVGTHDKNPCFLRPFFNPLFLFSATAARERNQRRHPNRQTAASSSPLPRAASLPRTVLVSCPLSSLARLVPAPTSCRFSRRLTRARRFGRRQSAPFRRSAGPVRQRLGFRPGLFAVERVLLRGEGAVPARSGGGG